MSKVLQLSRLQRNEVDMTQASVRGLGCCGIAGPGCRVVWESSDGKFVFRSSGY